MSNAYKKQFAQIVAFIAVAFMVSGCFESSSTLDVSSDDQNQTFHWEIFGWGACIGTCGVDNGIQTRSVVCQSSTTAAAVDDSFCPSPKPATTQECTASRCEIVGITNMVIKQTGQVATHKDFDDGFYKKGVHINYTRGNDIVVDHATGLMWQDNSIVADEDAQDSYGQAIIHCASLSLGGYMDWRVPTMQELQSIVDSSKASPAIDTVFENAASLRYWSSTEYVGVEQNQWYVDFDDGKSNAHYEFNDMSVRCVRGDVPLLTDFSRDDTHGIVMDNITGRMWQDNEVGTTTNLAGAIARCESLVLGGYSDWRLPNRNELLSIVDYSTLSPSIDAQFQNTGVNYWSSTADASMSLAGWNVYFNMGRSYNYYDGAMSYVRCVRAGE